MTDPKAAALAEALHTTGNPRRGETNLDECPFDEHYYRKATPILAALEASGWTLIPTADLPPTRWCPLHHAYDHCEDATLAALGLRERLATAICSTWDMPEHDHEAFLQPDHCENGLRDADLLLPFLTPTTESAPALPRVGQIIVTPPEQSSLDAYLEGRDDIPNRDSIRFAALQDIEQARAALPTTESAPGLREALARIAEVLDQSGGDRYAIEARGIARAALAAGADDK